jgi:hypothetical protein
MDKNRNLHNGIGIQVGQIQEIEIKETAEERRNGKSKAADKKRNINDGFMGVFCQNSNPTADPLGTELLRRKNSDGYEMKKVGFRDNGHMVSCEGQLTVGIDGGNDCDGRTRSFPLGRHLNLASERSGSNIAGEQRRPGHRKAKTRAQNVKACDSAVHMGFSQARRHFQNVGMPCHHPAVISKTRACHIITRTLFSKTADAAHFNSAVISKNTDVTRLHSTIVSKAAGMARYHSAVTSKTSTSPSITRLLPLKRRCRHQSLGCYS